jgi:hypothetical protein
MASRFGVFSPAELDLLQDVYNQVTDGLTSVDDASMADVAHALFQAYLSGVTERDELQDVAARALYRRTA